MFDINLRDYQSETITKLRQSVSSGKRRPVVQAPTGAGKTVMAAALVQMARRNNGRIIFCVPAISLIDQTVERFEANGIDAEDIGVIQANHYRTNRHAPVQVASIQTLTRRELDQFDLAIIDECHVSFKFYKTWFELESWENIPIIGLTATPWAKGMGKLWDDLIVCTTTAELIELGHLSDFKVFAPSHPDLSGVKTVLGDYDLKGLGQVMDAKPLVADIVSTWLERAEYRPTLCFAVNRLHAKHLQQQFAEAGIPTDYQDAHTEMAERKLIADRFQRGETKIVCNVGTLTTGIDWDVRCVILARPTKSEILYTQIIGRGLRTAEGKDHCIARGSKILTDKGLVNIEDITFEHKVWDGVNFVSHAGAVCRGIQPVLKYAGLIATSDHLVMTVDGWKTIAEAFSGRLGIAVTGFGERPIRFTPDYFTCYIRFCGSFACRGHVSEMRKVGETVLQTEREVWDILNAGPLQRFTANGLLVHNCLILDHSDTTLRLGFVTDIHHDRLDAGVANSVKKEKPVLLPKECPKCHYLRPPKVSICPSCGFKAEAVNKIEAGDGELRELNRKTKQQAEPKFDPLENERFYRELVQYSKMQGYKDGWAYYAYQDKFKAKPLNWFRNDGIAITPTTASWIKHRNIARAKAKLRNGN